MRQNDMELFIGIAFVIVIGVGVFAVLNSNQLPGAQQDPLVKVKEDAMSNISLDNNNDTGNTLGESLKRDDAFNTPADSTSSPTSKEFKQYANPPAQELVPNIDYKATLETNKGNIVIDLFENKTPATVNNFVFLARDGFYNETKSHRIINGFMVQFGDPLTKDTSKKAQWGTGGPGYRFRDESFEGEYSRGIVAMANSGPNTNGSQFFIMHQTTALPKNYVIFGEVTEASSLSVLDAIANTPVTASRSGERSSPTQDITLLGVDITETEKSTTLPNSEGTPKDGTNVGEEDAPNNEEEETNTEESSGDTSENSNN